jgi:hypothetical protein
MSDSEQKGDMDKPAVKEPDSNYFVSEEAVDKLLAEDDLSAIMFDLEYPFWKTFKHLRVAK